MAGKTVLVSAIFSFGLVHLAKSDLNVLFIGNSFTYYNDMPTMVQNLAAADGETMTFTQRTEGGWHFYNHTFSQETIDAIHSQPWDVVVLQEFSQGLAQTDETICRETWPFAQYLVNEILTSSPNSRIQFYQTWGYESASPSLCSSMANPYMCDYYIMQDRITEGYDALACQLAPANVAPVGEGFRYIRDNYRVEAFQALYQSDPTDDHPTEQGSYLSACTHYSALFGNPCSGNTYHGLSPLDSDTAVMLQGASDDVTAAGDWEFVPGTCEETFTAC